MGTRKGQQQLKHHGQGLAAAPTGSCEYASAGNRTRATSMATMYSAARPLMQPVHVMCTVWKQTPCLCSLSLWRPAVIISGGSSCVLISGTKKTHCGQRMAALTCDYRTRHQTPATLHERRQGSLSCGHRPASSDACISRESNPGHIDGDDVLCH